MATTYGGTNLQTAYNFLVKKGGVKIGSPQVVNEFIDILGLHGVVHTGQKLTTRQITVEGFIVGTDNADLLTKLTGLENLIAGSLTTAPVDLVAGTVTGKSFVPGDSGWGSTSFDNCYYDGTFEADIIGFDKDVAKIKFTLIQSDPFIT